MANLPADAVDAVDAVDAPVHVQAFEAIVHKLGHWTTARIFEVRARRGGALLDLRSPGIPAGDVEVRVDLDRSVLKLLVPDDAIVDQWGLRFDHRGRVKDAHGRGALAGRTIRLTGRVDRGEIRVRRSGAAVLSAIFTREFLADARASRRAGHQPTVADPAASFSTSATTATAATNTNPRR
ncbi:hypothetical protein [Parafrankia sp. EUN1f]|uniref:hypothetical protein n=1 Tax=Parafrankia sp. EUN1f TaxID=102897 RepID=UPI0001C43E65|nr:hypothetical protein [Parafrankia sp. EUN1f]EFC85103.1 hypothetical protein FrEUN1fDRAFT_1732 [Parafrankia sp. EUN1f]